MTTALSFEEVKTRQQKTWSSGDYGKVAWITVPLAEALCDAVGLRPGSAVLDVATGTGHVALAAARRFCAVTGVDYVPALLQEARARAGAEHLQVQFGEGDAEELPCADGSFDYVLSAIGVMFTADHQRAADELLRVCRGGGVVGLANWTPAGFIGQMLKLVGRHVPPPPGVRPPTRWGTEDGIRELLGAGTCRAGLHHGQRDAAFPVAGVLRRLLPEVLRTHTQGVRSAHGGRQARVPRRPHRPGHRREPGDGRHAGQRLGVPDHGRHQVTAGAAMLTARPPPVRWPSGCAWCGRGSAGRA